MTSHRRPGCLRGSPRRSVPGSQAAPELVCPFVEIRGEELRQQIAMGGMDLHTVKPRSLAPARLPARTPLKSARFRPASWLDRPDRFPSTGLRDRLLRFAVKDTRFAENTPPAPPNVIFNGDFEQAAVISSPPGWTMWGAERFKVAANYTRDTANPHGGMACLRIHCPADTAGYLVTHPTCAMRPKPGISFQVKFGAGQQTAYVAVRDHSLRDPSPPCASHM